MTTREPCGSMATRQALRMAGESAAEMPHRRQASLNWRPMEWRECSPRSELQSGFKGSSQTARQPGSQTARQPDGQTDRQPDGQTDRQTVSSLNGREESFPASLAWIPMSSPFSSPCPSRPKRPITILQGIEVIWMRPKHQSQSFCSPIFLAETFGRRALY